MFCGCSRFQPKSERYPSETWEEAFRRRQNGLELAFVSNTNSLSIQTAVLLLVQYQIHFLGSNGDIQTQC